MSGPPGVDSAHVEDGRPLFQQHFDLFCIYRGGAPNFKVSRCYSRDDGVQGKFGGLDITPRFNARLLQAQTIIFLILLLFEPGLSNGKFHREPIVAIGLPEPIYCLDGGRGFRLSVQVAISRDQILIGGAEFRLGGNRKLK